MGYEKSWSWIKNSELPKLWRQLTANHQNHPQPLFRLSRLNLFSFFNLMNVKLKRELRSKFFPLIDEILYWKFVETKQEKEIKHKVQIYRKFPQEKPRKLNIFKQETNKRLKCSMKMPLRNRINVIKAASTLWAAQRKQHKSNWWLRRDAAFGYSPARWKVLLFRTF